MDKAKAWLENYWYHYKWVTIIVTFFSLAALLCFSQCAEKKSYDLYLLYAGPGYLGREQYVSLSHACEAYMDEEKKNTCVNSLVYVSQATKEQYEKDDVYLNEGINQQSKNEFFDLLYSGSFNFLMLDPELYESVEKEKLLTPLSDIASPNASYESADGYGIRLSDTDLREKFAVFSLLPEDTVLCFRQHVLIQRLSGSKKRNEEAYSYQQTVFCRMVGIA